MAGIAGRSRPIVHLIRQPVIGQAPPVAYRPLRPSPAIGQGRRRPTRRTTRVQPVLGVPSTPPVPFLSLAPSVAVRRALRARRKVGGRAPSSPILAQPAPIFYRPLTPSIAVRSRAQVGRRVRLAPTYLPIVGPFAPVVPPVLPEPVADAPTGLTFSPPVDANVSPITDYFGNVPSGTDRLATRLFAHYRNNLRGRNVYLMMDGSLSEEQPPNFDPADPTAPIAWSYTYAGGANPPDGVTSFSLPASQQVRRVFWGARANPVTAEEAAILRAAGYTVDGQ